MYLNEYVFVKHKIFFTFAYSSSISKHLMLVLTNLNHKLPFVLFPLISDFHMHFVRSLDRPPVTEDKLQSFVRDVHRRDAIVLIVEVLDMNTQKVQMSYKSF